MKVILDQLASHRAHLETGVVIGIVVGLIVTLTMPEVSTATAVAFSAFGFFAGSVLSRSLSAYARSIEGDDDGDL
jgi:hypothetical protein